MGWIAHEGANFMDLDSVRGTQIYKPGAIEKPYKQGNFFIEFGLNGWDSPDCNVNFSTSGSNCCKDWLTLWYDDGNGGTLEGYRHTIDNTNDFVIENIDDGECIYKTQLDNNDEPAYSLNGRRYDNGDSVHYFDTGSYTDDGTPRIFNFVTQGCGKYSTATTTNGHKIKYFGDDGTEDNGSTSGKTLATGTIHNNPLLREIYVPFRYTIIKDGAFSGNTNLTAVTFARVEKVGESAGYSGGTVPSNPETLPKGPFYNCNMEYVDFMRTCELLPEECDVIENQLKVIGDNAFRQDSSYTLKAIKLTNSTTDFTLSGATNLEYIGYKAFYNNILSAVTIPGNVKVIAPYAFAKSTVQSSYPMSKIVLDSSVGSMSPSSDPSLTIFNHAFENNTGCVIDITNAVKIDLMANNFDPSTKVNLKSCHSPSDEVGLWYKGHSEWNQLELYDADGNRIN